MSLSVYSMPLLEFHHGVPMYNYLHTKSFHSYYFQENPVLLFSYAQYIHPCNLALGCIKMNFLWMMPEDPGIKSVAFPMSTNNWNLYEEANSTTLKYITLLMTFYQWWCLEHRKKMVNYRHFMSLTRVSKQQICSKKAIK